jgi:hypothetical protein
MKRSNLSKSSTSSRNAGQSPNGRMEAIACGVKARLEERTSYDRTVTDETVNIARALGVADREINTWVNQRIKQLAQDEDRLRSIKVLLEQVRSDITM